MKNELKKTREKTSNVDLKKSIDKKLKYLNKKEIVKK